MTNSSIKILVIAESIDFEASSGAKANIALIKNLIACGYILKVYHYSLKKIPIDGAESISISERRRSVLFFLSRTERYLRYFFNISLNPKIEKEIGFSFTLMNDRKSILKAIQKENDFRAKWVLTLSQGGSFRPHHVLLKMPKLQDKWLAYIHDPYPMHWYPKPYTWKEAGFKKKQAFMESVADKCAFALFPSLYLKEWMGFKYSKYTEKGVVVPHQLYTEIRGGTPNPGQMDINGFTILHAGNLLQARQPQGLVEGFKKFMERNPDAKAGLIHIGPAPHYSEYLKKEAENSEFISVYCESKPFDEVTWLQGNASANVIMEAKAKFSPFLPGKFPHCVKANKPIIHLGPEKSETRRLLGYNYPYAAEIDDISRISDIIERLYFEWKVDENLELNRPDLEEYLSADHLRQIIQNLPEKK